VTPVPRTRRTILDSLPETHVLHDVLLPFDPIKANSVLLMVAQGLHHENHANHCHSTGHNPWLVT
jgi:hypothetical protein